MAIVLCFHVIWSLIYCAAEVYTLTFPISLYFTGALTPPTLTTSSTIRPVNGTNLRLTCNVGTQAVHNVYFYRNEEVVNCTMAHLSCNDFSPILNFSPILDIDTGNYSCIIRNPVSQNISQFMFLNVAGEIQESR